ncbi:MAG TPA: GIY-YIG nuclease family protein [Polyangiaceae bacterium]|nr:GIY-YIG nuclease family protein [Polyangiaceae bacterium]
MCELLSKLEALALDCQASGATPAHGDLLELGWAKCGAEGTVGPVYSRWIVPRTSRKIGRAVRELTGWSEARAADAVPEREAWGALCEEIELLARGSALPAVPTVIHFARFELSFLRDLHARLGTPTNFPFDAVCLHAIAVRLFPDLPRRNIRALAGYLGHSPELVRRSAGHVEATAFIWRALVPRLDAAGVRTWSELKAWLSETSAGPRPARRVYPLASEVRRRLPDAPGVYRFVRKSGDVLYVGKATSLKRRVASHFTSRGPATERGLELLTQVYDIAHTQTPSLLEAALLESDEIKRLDPPYNVQLRSQDRRAWFAARDYSGALTAPDDEHPIGPLPSERALAPLAALIELAGGSEATKALRAAALAVPISSLPEPELFELGFRGFFSDYLSKSEAPAPRRVTEAARELWLARGRSEAESSSEDDLPNVWDLARVRRRLERNLVQAGLLLRRARWLALLADATVAFREREMAGARAVVVARGEIVEQLELESIAAVSWPREARPAALRTRQGYFDIATYDRLRVLVSEICRIQVDGGEVALRIGRHRLCGARLATLMRAI